MSEPRRFTLEERDFACLVRGGVVNLFLAGGTKIEVKLADIGWDRMYFQIELAIREAQEDA